MALHQSFSRPPRFTESEAAALAAAAQALGGEGRERAVKALRDSVPRDRRASFDELSQRIYAGAPPAPDSVLGRLQRAIAERRAVRLAYHSASRDAETDRVVHPYTLAQRFGHWYLYGFDRQRGRPLAFRLDRIRGCQPWRSASSRPTRPSWAACGSSRESAAEPVHIRIAPGATGWALARPGIRLVKRTEDGGAVVAVDAGEEWATRFALSLGGQAEVMAPAAARKHFAERVRRTLARYGAAALRPDSRSGWDQRTPFAADPGSAGRAPLRLDLTEIGAVPVGTRCACPMGVGGGQGDGTVAHVLIVDDTDIVRRALELAVRRMGHAAVSTSDALEALALAERQPPDLALLDYRMPQMSGAVAVPAAPADAGQPLPQGRVRVGDGAGRGGARGRAHRPRRRVHEEAVRARRSHPAGRRGAG